MACDYGVKWGVEETILGFRTPKKFIGKSGWYGSTLSSCRIVLFGHFSCGGSDLKSRDTSDVCWVPLEEVASLNFYVDSTSISIVIHHLLEGMVSNMVVEVEAVCKEYFHD